MVVLIISLVVLLIPLLICLTLNLNNLLEPTNIKESLDLNNGKVGRFDSFKDYLIRIYRFDSQGRTCILCLFVIITAYAIQFMWETGCSVVDTAINVFFLTIMGYICVMPLARTPKEKEKKWKDLNRSQKMSAVIILIVMFIAGAIMTDDLANRDLNRQQLEQLKD